MSHLSGPSMLAKLLAIPLSELTRILDWQIPFLAKLIQSFQ